MGISFVVVFFARAAPDVRLYPLSILQAAFFTKHLQI